MMRLVYLYALRDRSVGELVAFFPSRQKAEETLEEILSDEPQWRDQLDLLPVGFEVSPN
jgi:hypothetical protein